MAVRGAKNRNRPQRQKAPERPKALRRPSLIEVAAANQDAAENERNALSAMFQETASPIHRQKQDEKKELEGTDENPGTAAKEFKRCRPIVEMMEHVFTEPAAATDQALFGEQLFPRIPVDAQTGRRQVRLIKGCEGLTEEAEPGRDIGKKNKKGKPVLTPLAEIETTQGHMSQEDWQAAAEARMSLFRKRLDHGEGPGWAEFWKIKNETEERKRGGKSMRGKWNRRFRLLKGCFGAYSSMTFPLASETERDVEWHKQKVLNVSEVLNNDDDDNGWSHALMAFVEHCRAKGFELPGADERPWRELGVLEATSRASSGASPPPGGMGRTSPALMAGNKEWVIQAVKNPKLCAFTYIVEARILMQRAQDLSGAYRSFLKVTTKADSPLCLIDPVLRKLFFKTFSADLRDKVSSNAPLLRRSSAVGHGGGGVTPKPSTETAPAAAAGPEAPSQVTAPAETTELSSEQLSVQEGAATADDPHANGVQPSADVDAPATEMP